MVGNSILITSIITPTDHHCVTCVLAGSCCHLNREGIPHVCWQYSTTGEANKAVGEGEELLYTLALIANLEEGAMSYEGAAGFDECEWEIWGCMLDGDQAEGNTLCLESTMKG